MKEFLSANPVLAQWVIGVLITIIGGLATTIIFFVKRSIDNLTNAIVDLRVTLDVERADIGKLKDRMQKVETTCKI